MVADVTVDPGGAGVSVDRVVLAADAGRVINPDGARNQLAGTIRTADFSRATVSYVVQVGDHELNVDEHSTERLEPGTPVYLQLPSDRIWLFPHGNG